MAFFSARELWQSFIGCMKLSSRQPIIDRRQKPRRLYMQDGYLTFPNKPAYPATLCLIRDISPVGARVELSDDVPSDELFLGRIRLYIPDRKHERECQIAWREDRIIGFKFLSDRLLPSRDYRHATQRGGGTRPPPVNLSYD